MATATRARRMPQRSRKAPEPFSVSDHLANAWREFNRQMDHACRVFQFWSTIVLWSAIFGYIAFH